MIVKRLAFYSVVNARTEDDVKKVVTDITNGDGTAHGITADISAVEGVQKLVQGSVERFGAIDILVHNAGIFPFQMLDAMEDSDWQQVLDTNLTSAFRLTKACIPQMKAER